MNDAYCTVFTWCFGIMYTVVVCTCVFLFFCETVFAPPPSPISNTSAQGRNLYGSSTEREKTPESSSFPVEAFFDTNAAGVSSHFGLLPSVLSMSQSKPQPTSSGTETIPAVLSEEDDVDTIYDDDDDDDMDSEYSDLYAEDYMCVCGQCN